RSQSGIAIKVKRSDCPSKAFPIAMASIMGSDKAVTRYIKEHPEIQTIDLPTAARKLVEIEVIANPTEVGPPVDVISFDKGKARWIQKKPECPEIETLSGTFNGSKKPVRRQ